jgi:transposase-like protein
MEKESRFAELIRQQEESGLSVKDFCYNQDCAPSTFHYWRKKLRLSTQEKFIPLIVKSPVRTISTRNNHGAHRSRHQGSDEDQMMLELVYPNGTRLRINKEMDLAQVRLLIRLFD